MKTSYSKIGSFWFCPKCYEYRYVLECAAPPKPEPVFGKSLHAALELNFEQKTKTRQDLPAEEIVAHFKKELDEGLKAVPEESLRKKSTEYHYLMRMGEQLLREFMERRAPSLQPSPRGVECRFKLPLPEDHEITGVFDLLDTNWVLHDFKTSSKPYHRSRADKTQLIIYAWACQHLFGRSPKELVFDVFIKGDGEDGFIGLQDPVVFPTPAQTDMARVAERLVQKINTILETQENKNFVRSFNPGRCHWCEYQAACEDDWHKSGEPAPVRLASDGLV
ncbi:MAG TPA: PD-(D/E)XK nuclease family protein [Elusimicrobiota bacterium]|nr:PD-(D/E)XK nuclease family protein [Elusimicrobiota bacterium]